MIDKLNFYERKSEPMKKEKLFKWWEKKYTIAGDFLQGGFFALIGWFFLVVVIGTSDDAELLTEPILKTILIVLLSLGISSIIAGVTIFIVGGLTDLWRYFF